MKLVRAAAGDLAEVVALMNHAFRGTGEGASWNVESGILTGDRVRLDDLRAELAATPAMQLLLWRDDVGAVLGCFSLELLADGAGYLGMLTVRPDRQDAKLGRALLAAAEKRAREDGATRMRMSVLSVRDTLIAWYLRRGYHLTGEARPFPYGDDRWGIPQRSDLEFVLLEKSLDA